MHQIVTLNALSLTGFPETVSLYYRRAVKGEARTSQRHYLDHTVPREPHWVAFSPTADLNLTKSVYTGSNSWLTLDLAREALFDTAKAHRIPQYARTDKPFFEDTLEVIMEEFQEGQRIMAVRPIAAPILGGIGLLFMEDFRVRAGVPYSRKVQMLTGSLDPNGRPNAQYHVQAWNRLKGFLADPARGQALKTLRHDATKASLKVGADFKHVEGQLLHKRRFKFGSDREGKHHTGDSQLYGIRDFGPFAQPTGSQKFLTYVSTEPDRPIARILYQALHDGRSGSAFEGFQRLFKYNLPLNPDAKFISLKDFSSTSIVEAAAQLAKAPNGKNTIAAIIISRGMENNEEIYVRLKAALLQHEIPSQFCTRELTAASRSLEWATANIALGIFAKIGGSPWRVESNSKPAIILGVAQAVDSTLMPDGNRKITRQIAYSVLTDSTGEFRKLEVLADIHQGQDSTGEYIAALKGGLLELVEAQAGKTHLVVLHLPFRPKREFVEAVKSVVDEARTRWGGTCEFCVIKINDSSQHSWFGYLEEANSMVPIESTLVKIGLGEYLLWFEGQDAKRRLAKKKYGGPTHVRFLTAPPSDETVNQILNDLVDLAGANWRGFNARSEPVSVYYCYLVAKFLKSCRRFDVTLPNVANLNPWFL